jgi:hypothetical protein
VDVIGGPVMPDPDGVAGHYVICPGNAVTLGMMGTFNNCNPVWQYKFDVPGSLWSDLGTGNGQQQSNTLPQTFPPNPSNSPYLWPPGANCILYRVECRPLSYPNSGCMPCHSNEIQICLKPMPPAPVIQSSKNWFCEGGAETMVITNFDINTFYNWYCNGVLTSSSSSSQFNATQPGCYWTSFSDGCYTKTSNTLCFTECEPVAIMKCPEDNPCACYFQPLTFDASMSYSNCGTIVNYQWTAYDAVNNVTVTQNGPSPTFSITFDPTTSPPFTSATISLTVTDVNGCTDDVKPLTIVPCEGP